MAPFLHGLCSDGSPDEVRAALVKGEKVNQRDAYGNTALMMAASFGNEEVVELLLQQPRLNVNLTKKEDKVFGGHVTALHIACYQGWFGVVKMLLAHPSLTCHNAVNKNGETALMMAVGKNNVQCVRELVAVEGGTWKLETRSEGVWRRWLASGQIRRLGRW